MVKVKQKKQPLTRQDFQNWGKAGGGKNKLKGKEYFSEMGKKGAVKRWANKKQTNEKEN